MLNKNDKQSSRLISGFVFENKLRCIVLLFVCVCAHASVFSQQAGYSFENINSSRGSANRNVNAIVQDAEGFIWFGSDEGLTRYDGYNFLVYKHDNNDPYSLSDNSVFTLCIDGEGSVWAGTGNGLNRFDAKQNRFDVFMHDDKNENSVSANNIISLARDNNGSVWIGTYGGGLDKAEFRNGKYHFIHHRHDDKNDKSISDNQVYSIAFDKHNNAWVGTSKSLNILVNKTDDFVHFYYQSGNKNSINGKIARIVPAADGSVWLCGYNILDKVLFSSSTQSLSIQHILPLLSTSEEWIINDFFIDSKNQYWAATNYQGLIKFSVSDNEHITKTIFANDPQNPGSLPSSNVYSIFEDRSGVIWTGTSKGLSKYISLKEYFNEPSNVRMSLPELRFVLSLAAAKDSTILLTPETDSLFIIKKINSNYSYKIISPFLSPGGLDQVNIIYSSASGDFIVGTMLHGFYIISSSNKYDKTKWQQIDARQYPLLPGNNIYSFADGDDGSLWVGAYKGLCLFDRKTNMLEPVYISPSDKVELPYIIRAIVTDKQKRIWCGTDEGLRVFQNKKLIAAYTADSKNKTAICNDKITYLYKDHSNNIWVGTQGGLNLFKSGTDSAISFTTKNGLPDDGIQSIVEDAGGDIWIATNHGLAKYASAKNKFFSYTIKDGLPADQFTNASACSPADGLLYFGTNDGVVSFNPAHITANTYIPPVVITQVKVMNKNIEEDDDSVLLNTFRQKKILQLAYNQNFFSFEFAALNYINTENNQYAYQLEGIDKDWIYSGTQHFASYTDIKPGHYTFKVKGSNNDGIWNDKPAIVEVIILPPWWQTWWFYALCVLAFCGIIYIIYRVRLRQILQLYKLRSSIAKDLHDDVGSALSSIAMLSRLAQDGKTKAVMKPEEIYSRIGDTSKRMIDLMDDIVWSVNPDNDRFSNMLVRMREYAAEMLEPNNINFAFKVSDDIEELRIPMQMRKDYFLIFKEAVNNLAKYSACSEALISIEKQQRNIITLIKDNGKGFNSSITTSGNGLRNMEERATAINGKIDIKTKEGEGTAVMITIVAN